MIPPTPWIAKLLAHFREDPVVDLGRIDMPSHALVVAVHRARRDDRAVVTYRIIHGPPPPSAVVYGGDFATAPPLGEPWFVFVRGLEVEENVRRLVAAASGSIAIFGKRGGPPLCADEAVSLSRGGEPRPAAPVLRGSVPPPEPPPPPPPPGIGIASAGNGHGLPPVGPGLPPDPVTQPVVRRSVAKSAALTAGAPKGGAPVAGPPPSPRRRSTIPPLPPPPEPPPPPSFRPDKLKP